MLVIPDNIRSVLSWTLNKENNVYIKNIELVTSKITKINEMTCESLHLIADFDMTLTKFWHNGQRSTSSHGVIEKSSVMPETAKKALKELYLKYYPMEISLSISREDKYKLMEEWWFKVHQIFSKYFSFLI